jgi:pimeloyl-ACP methyl ester carboxylesterase
MTRRTALWSLGIATVVLGLILLGIDQRLYDQGGPGIIGFELAGSKERAQQILAEWGPHGRDAARLSLWIDYLYLAAYGAFFALASLATRDHARRVGWRRYAAVGTAMAALAVAGAAFDAVEDVFLLLTLGGHGGAAAPRIAAICATLKFACLTVVDVYILSALVRRAWRRWPRGAPATVAALVLLVAGVLAYNALTFGRETQAARAEAGGRILHLPGGDMQVRVDGTDGRGAEPLLLIHGFASSLHWWDRVVPLLDRRRRVIRVDLLGHGGSEKPRNGYSMENQADLVAAAMRRLGVSHVVLVAHSMGGIVGTALVQRHPGLVTKIVTIATPPDGDAAKKPPPLRRLADAPIIGPTVRRLASNSQIRAELERSAMAPRTDVPEQFVDDINRTTYTSFRESGRENADYRNDEALPKRLAHAGVPLLALDGSEDELVDPSTLKQWRVVPGARTILLPGIGHTAQWEAPGITAALILAFAS